MRVEVDALKAFYASPLGRMAARQISRRTAEMWPNLKGQTVVGIGYALPVLDSIARTAGTERVAALMPAQQGAWRWPEVSGGKPETSDGDTPPGTLSALVEETALPLPDRSVDRIILLHALEDVEALQPFLREIWRVLTDSGCVLAIAASRRGLWCRSDASPFGHGRPYSMRQLRQALAQSMFTPEAEARALYALPSARALPVWSADAAERYGRRWLRRFGGVVMINASKSLYGAAPAGKASARKGAIILEAGGLKRSKTTRTTRVRAKDHPPED